PTGWCRRYGRPGTRWSSPRAACRSVHPTHPWHDFRICPAPAVAYRQAMEPVSPTRAVSMRTLLLTCLGLLALVSVAVALVVSQSSSAGQNRTGARAGDNGLGGASASATVATDATDGPGSGGGSGDTTGNGGATTQPTWTPTHTTQAGP